jgi:5-formyltetrahydrofolate cyclo-ligase
MTKKQWRARLLAARRARPAAELAEARRRIAWHLTADLVTPTAAEAAAAPTTPPTPAERSAPTTPPTPAHRAAAGADTVCAYLPLGTEPLPPELPGLLAAAGWRVLLPIARRGQPLDWCLLTLDGPIVYDAVPTASTDLRGSAPGFVIGDFGVAEPTGPRLGAGAIADADVVLVPALAVDRTGTRLGRGGGFYDRSLALAHGGTRRANPSCAREARRREQAETPRLVAVVFDGEVVDELPRGPHDVPVGEVVSPSGGIRRPGGERVHDQ